MKIISSHFGVHADYNAAALHLIKNNRIDAVSCFAFSERLEKDYHALIRSKQNNPSLEIGLAFILSSKIFKPLSAHFPNGCFLPHEHFSCNAWLGLLDRDALKIELLAQWAAFQEIFGQAPDFIEGWRNIQNLPQISQIMAEILSEQAFQAVVLLMKRQYFQFSVSAYQAKKHYQKYQINMEQDICHLTPHLFKRIKQFQAEKYQQVKLPKIIYTTPRLYKLDEAAINSGSFSACEQFHQLMAMDRL